MRKINKLFAAGVIAAAGAATTSAFAADVELRLGNGTGPSAKIAAEKFIEMVQERSNNAISIAHFPDNQLGDDRVMAETVVFGDLDIAILSTSNAATIFNDLYLFDAPYLFLDSKQAYEALDGPVGQAILDGMKDKGVLGLAFWENGFRNLTNDSKEIRVPDDVKGLKIRTMENPVHLDAWKSFGANPTPMAFVELFTALQQGAVDGQENPLSLIESNKFYDVQGYISLTQHVYTPYVVMMNHDKFETLSEEQQKIIVDTMKEATALQREQSQNFDLDLVEKFRKDGVTVSELTNDEKALWQKKVMDANVFDVAKSKMQHPELLDKLF